MNSRCLRSKSCVYTIRACRKYISKNKTWSHRLLDDTSGVESALKWNNIIACNIFKINAGFDDGRIEPAVENCWNSKYLNQANNFWGLKTSTIRVYCDYHSVINIILSISPTVSILIWLFSMPDWGSHVSLIPLYLTHPSRYQFGPASLYLLKECIPTAWCNNHHVTMFEMPAFSSSKFYLWYLSWRGLNSFAVVVYE